MPTDAAVPAAIVRSSSAPDGREVAEGSDDTAGRHQIVAPPARARLRGDRYPGHAPAGCARGAAPAAADLVEHVLDVEPAGPRDLARRGAAPEAVAQVGGGAVEDLRDVGRRRARSCSRRSRAIWRIAAATRSSRDGTCSDSSSMAGTSVVDDGRRRRGLGRCCGLGYPSTLVDHTHDRGAGVSSLTPEALERLVLGDPVALHQQALGALDPRAAVEGAEQVAELAVALDRDVDAAGELGLVGRVEVGEDAVARGLREELAARVGRRAGRPGRSPRRRSRGSARARARCPRAARRSRGPGGARGSPARSPRARPRARSPRGRARAARRRPARARACSRRRRARAAPRLRPAHQRTPGQALEDPQRQRHRAAPELLRDARAAARSAAAAGRRRSAPPCT